MTSLDDATRRSTPSHRLTGLFAASGLALLITLGPSASRAEGPPEGAGANAASPAQTGAATPAEKKARYSLPWLMRPAIAPDIVRVDSGIAMREQAAGAETQTGTTYASTLTAGAKPFGDLPLGFYGRAALVHDTIASGTIVSNPLAFALYTPEVAPSLRLALFGGVTLPVGGGGGNDPVKSSRATAASGIYARQAMDNALFATNYTTPTAGVGLAWIKDGLTAQAEVTVLELIRTRGSDVDKDSTRTNFTSGLHVGYQIIPALTASVEAHYQRWLSTPAAVEANDALRQQATVGGGLRANVPLSATMLMRPGVAYFQGIDDPMSTGKYRIIQVDLPFAF